MDEAPEEEATAVAAEDDTSEPPKQSTEEDHAKATENQSASSASSEPSGDAEDTSTEPLKEAEPMEPGEDTAEAGIVEEGGMSKGRDVVEEGGVTNEEGGVGEKGGVAKEEGEAEEGGVAEGGIAKEEGVAEEGGVAEGSIAKEEEGVAEEGGVAKGGIKEGGMAEGMTEEGSMAEGEGMAEEEGEQGTETSASDDKETDAEKQLSASQEKAADETTKPEPPNQPIEAAEEAEPKEKEEKKEEKEEEEEEQVFEYDYQVMKSTSETVNTSITNMLELHHSFGYECHKRFNLVVLAKDVVAYSAGNMVIILNLSTREQKCFRSLGGGGIGAIAAHPSQSYLAVGEKGTDPVIAIFTYPELNLHRILRGGTEAMYSHMDFSPGDGNLLASIGGDPDFMLTVWDWTREKIVLRSKAFSQDIYRVSFSPENAQQLTTSGTGHIRFWKMAATFTGLKLQGQLGKFGRIEISDISAYVELPDGKVLSGTEWGNFLLWDGGFIKVELSKKGKKFCHNGMIEAIYLDEGELISAGVDGYIRVWNFETIDSADMSDESATFEIEPMTEIKVGNNVCFKSLVHSVDPDMPNLWYGQDASGAVWKIDIVVSHTRRAPEKLMTFHGGKITGVDCSPISHQAASISQNGSVRVYSLPDKQLLCHSEFASGGSCLIWAPTSVDNQAITVIAGFTDGVVRVLRLEEREGRSSTHHKGHSGKYWLNLVHACKPHKQAVTNIAVDPEGKILASGGKDSIVFFLSIQEDYSPIGFIHAPSAVQSLQWSSGKGQDLYLLVCCVDGSMMEVEAPVKGQYDTAKTYYLDPLKFTTRKFASIKDKLRAQEEEARHEVERQKKLVLKEAKRQKRKELMGEDYISEEEEEQEEEEEEEEVQVEEEKPKGPPSILEAFYSKGDTRKYWVSMDGYDAGYLYCCSMEGASQKSELYEPPHSIAVPEINGEDLPLHSVTFSVSGEYFLTGTSNGCVRLHPLSTPHTLDDLSSYWSLNMHDNHYGTVTCLSTTFDDQYVLSGGEDGNLFIYKANLPTAAQRAEAAILKIPRQSEETALDIDDPEHYSIEDAKQKAEHDKKMKLAEEKKQHVRRQIASLRRTFTKLQNRNQQLPAHLQLGPEVFVMDPNMERNLREQAEERVALVHREMSWESEKHKIGLDKLRTKYKDRVDCEHFTVWAFHGGHRACSFRTAKSSKEFLECLTQITEQDPGSAQYPWTTATGGRGRNQEGKQSSKKAATKGQDSGKKGAEEEKREEDTKWEMSKEEWRKLRKQQRTQELLEHEQKKPDEKSDDPEDAAAFRQARENMGDYKLKTATDYVVPKAQRVTTERKRKELLLLRQRILNTKKDYNDKLLSLRDKKLRIIEKIKESVDKVVSLQSNMNPAHHKPLPPIPTIRPEEVPERVREYTRESLLKFKEEKAAREEAERQAAAGVGEGGFFGGFGGGGDEEGEEGEEGEEKREGQEDIATEDSVRTKLESHTAEGTDDGSTVVTDEGQTVVSDTSSEEVMVAAMTPTQRLIYQEHQIRCMFERDHVLDEIDSMQKEFDEVLMRLCHEKIHLDITMVTADIKHITQFEEMILLKDFDKRESSFTSRYKTKKKDKEAMAVKIEESQRDISEKEKHLAKLQEQEKTLIQAFTGSIGDNNKFKDFILKVFRKKIKRAKRKSEVGEVLKEGEEEEEDEEENEEDTDSDDISSSDEDSEAEGDLDDTVCPAGCDQVLFARACELREQRLDLEELIADEKKSLDIQRKELEAVKKKAKSMESQVKSALSDLQAFQLKKQQKLNELDQVAVLSLHQLLHYLSDGEPPTSIAPCLVFPASALYQLGQRIGELSQEKLHEKKRYKELKQNYKKLGREKKEMMADLSVLNERVNEAMLLKFGQIVDLEKLEVLSSNPVIEEKRQQLREMEQQGSREVATVQGKIELKKKEMVRLVQENTVKLNRMHDLITTMKEMGERLDTRQKSMSKEVSGGDSYLSDEEHEKLLEIIRLQAMDIENVRGEIELLQHKGGHILPPTQPPAPPPN